jgi:hypothetical protein
VDDRRCSAGGTPGEAIALVEAAEDLPQAGVPVAAGSIDEGRMIGSGDKALKTAFACQSVSASPGWHRTSAGMPTATGTTIFYLSISVLFTNERKKSYRKGNTRVGSSGKSTARILRRERLAAPVPSWKASMPARRMKRISGGASAVWAASGLPQPPRAGPDQSCAGRAGGCDGTGAIPYNLQNRGKSFSWQSPCRKRRFAIRWRNTGECTELRSPSGVPPPHG